MNQWILLFAGITVLLAIFVRRQRMSQLGFSPRKIFRNLKEGLHQLGHKQNTDAFEITIDEMIPARESIDPKKVLKADGFFKRGEVALEKGDLQNAAKLLIQSLALDPSNQMVYHKLGLLYLKQGQYSKAEMFYRKLILTAVEDPSYFSNLALALYQQKKLTEAKSFYQRAVELDQSRAGRFFSLAQVLYELQEFQQAIDHLQKAIGLEPKNADYHLTLAQFYLDQSMVNEAEKLLKELDILCPNNEIANEMKLKHFPPGASA